MRVKKRGSVTGDHQTAHSLESRFKLLAPQAYVSTAAPLQTRNDRISRSAEGAEWVSKHAHTRTPTALLPYLVLHAHNKDQHHHPIVARKLKFGHSRFVHRQSGADLEPPVTLQLSTPLHGPPKSSCHARARYLPLTPMRSRLK